MVRLYGEAPYKIVLVHGGPGAIGSLKEFAQELNRISQLGIVEAIQSKYSIAELIEELYGQICDNCSGRVVLIGHSWGAWLVALLAEKHPELVERIILVGSGPLEDKYVAEIGTRRVENLSEEEREVFHRLVNNQATDEDMAKIPKIFDKVDNYCLEDRDLHRADETDSQMHNLIWEEAAGLRSTGGLLVVFKQIKCEIVLIQGKTDPHPARGVVIPLQENGVDCKLRIILNGKQVLYNGQTLTFTKYFGTPCLFINNASQINMPKMQFVGGYPNEYCIYLKDLSKKEMDLITELDGNKIDIEEELARIP